MNFETLLSGVRRIVEDQGIRWDDLTIAQYTVRGVNHIYDATGENSKTAEKTVGTSGNQVDLSGIDGPVVAVRYFDSVAGDEYYLKRVALSEIPASTTEAGKTEYFAITHTDDVVAQDMDTERRMAFFPYADGTTGNAVFKVDYTMEWSFTSDVNATAAQLATDMPVRPKHEIDLINYVAGSLLREMNDQSMVEKGAFFLEGVEKSLEQYKAEMAKKVQRSTGQRTSTTMAFTDLLSDVRRIIENQVAQEGDNVTPEKLEDIGRRWDDRVIAQYAVRGLNFIYETLGMSSQTTSVSVGTSGNSVDLPQLYGPVNTIRYFDTVTLEEYYVKQVSLSEIPSDTTQTGVPQYFALTHSDTTIETDPKIVFYPYASAATTNGQFKVDYQMEWSFRSNPVANAAQLSTSVPIRPKHEVDLVNYVAGSILLEMNSEFMVQKGKMFLEGVTISLEKYKAYQDRKIQRSTGQRTGNNMTFSELLADVRRIVENHAQTVKDPTVMADIGRRWDDRVVAQYAERGVNYIYTKTGSVSDQLALNLVDGQDIYTMSIPGRILKVEVLPENDAPAVVLQQVQYLELPTVQLASNHRDPQYFALTQTVSGNDLKSTQDIVVFPTPDRTANGALVVTYAMEWEFFADPTATSTQLATEIPVLPKFEVDLVNYVVGHMFSEMGDTSMVQKGDFYIGSAEKEISNVSYVNSLNFWTNNPGRGFP